MSPLPQHVNVEKAFVGPFFAKANTLQQLTAVYWLNIIACTSVCYALFFRAYSAAPKRRSGHLLRNNSLPDRNVNASRNRRVSPPQTGENCLFRQSYDMSIRFAFFHPAYYLLLLLSHLLHLSMDDIWFEAFAVVSE